MPFAKFFYPRLTYTPPGGSQTIIDIVDPVAGIEIDEMVVAGENMAESGVRETLLVRTEYQVRLTFVHLTTAQLTDLMTLFRKMYGVQFALTLDRLATAGGQWEYDQYNSFFDKAELLDPRFLPRRSMTSRALYVLTVALRQGR